MSFLRQFVVYGLGGAASRLAAVFLVPLYTRTLSVPEYGELDVLLGISALMVIVAGMQLESSVARDFYEAARRGEYTQLLWSTVWLTVLGVSAVSAATGCAWLLGWLPSRLESPTLLLLLALTFPAQIFGVQLVVLRFAGRPVRYAVFSFLDLALSASFSVWFIVGLRMGIDGAIAGMLAGKTTCAMFAWPFTFGKAVRVTLKSDLVRRMLVYGIPSLPAVLVGWIQNAGSRLLLAIALTFSDVAISGIALKVAAIYSFLVQSFRLAWEPYSIASLDALDTDPRIYNRTLEWYVAAMFSIAGAAALASPLIVRVLATPAYEYSGTIAVLFLLGQFWAGMTNVLAIGIHGARRTSLLLPVFGYGALLNVAILFAFAPFVGVAAAGLGFAAGSMCSAFLARHYSNKHYNTGFTLRLVAWTGAASAGFAAGWYALCVHFAPVRDAGAWRVFASGLIILIAAIAVIALRGFAHGRSSAMWMHALGLIRRTVAAR